MEIIKGYFSLSDFWKSVTSNAWVSNDADRETCAALAEHFNIYASDAPEFQNSLSEKWPDVKSNL